MMVDSPLFCCWKILNLGLVVRKSLLVGEGSPLPNSLEIADSNMFWEKAGGETPPLRRNEMAY